MSEYRIRLATPGDAQAFLGIYAPYVLDTAVTYEYAVPSREEFARRIAETLRKYPYLAAEADGRVVGYAYAGTFIGRAASDWSVEVSIYLAPDCRRAGIGRRLYTALEGILKMQNIQNANAAIACAETEDEHLTADSIAFHSRMGYREVGSFSRCGHKFGRWYGLMWMEKHLGQHTDCPPPVRYLPEIAARAEGFLRENFTWQDER